MKLTFTSILFVLSGYATLAQVTKPDLQNLQKWQLLNREAEVINENELKAVKLSARQNDGMMLLQDFQFTEGTIELDIKGKNVPQQSFVGIAFHVQNEETFDAIYFRPFNFMNTDTVRRSRAVQYISMPEYPWEKLRAEFPGKYENKVKPVPDPDKWFHVRIVIERKQVRVYVDNSTTPSLEVAKLTETNTGKIGLWVGNGSDGSFANLVITAK
jgi:hypothetical protein